MLFYKTKRSLHLTRLASVRLLCTSIKARFEILSIYLTCYTFDMDVLFSNTVMIILLTLAVLSIYLFFKALFTRPVTIIYLLLGVVISILLLWWVPVLGFGLSFTRTPLTVMDIFYWSMYTFLPISLWISLLLLGFHYMENGNWILKLWKKIFIVSIVGLTICFNILFLLL